MIFPLPISIPQPTPPALRLAFPPDFSVGILIIAATGTRLKTIILKSASQNSQNS